MAFTKDQIDNPALWDLGMMIDAAGIDVFAHAAVGEAALVRGRIDFDASASSLASAVEEAVYANPMLLLPFRKVDILLDTDGAMAVPHEVDTEAVAALIDFEKEDDTLLRSPLDERNDLLFPVPRGLANFLRRTYDGTAPRHVLSALAAYHSKSARRGNRAKMFVNLARDSVDVLVYNRYGLAAARRVAGTADIQNAAYWILAIFQHCGLDAENDELSISGDASRRRELKDVLGRYINYVFPAIFPSAAYHGDSQAMLSPFPLTILSLCE